MKLQVSHHFVFSTIISVFISGTNVVPNVGPSKKAKVDVSAESKVKSFPKPAREAAQKKVGGIEVWKTLSWEQRLEHLEKKVGKPLKAKGPKQVQS